jgi:hypothetical protein
MIGKIQRVPIKEVWRNEAYDFTPWLRDNIDILNDILSFSLISAESEQSAGSFSVDIVAEDDSGNPVIIENQFGKSDHDHLGKLLTYLTVIESKTAIWIVENPRPEHINAISWLNESSSASFYLIKVEAVQIGDSKPAPLFTLIVGPSEESRQVGAIKKDISERYLIRHRFWSTLLKISKEKTKLHSNISPSQHSWISTSSGLRGLGFNYCIRQYDSQVELYVDRGLDSNDENNMIYDELFSNKDEIESTFGDSLLWERLESKRACRISKHLSLGGYRDENKWNEVTEEMVDSMIKFAKALKPYIKKLNL